MARSMTNTFSGIRPLGLLGSIPAQIAAAVLAT
jgi:hypothetical protein